MKFEHYIFDFDYTLFDTSAGMSKCYYQALNSVGIEYDSSLLNTYVKESLKATFERYKTKHKFKEFEEAFLITSKNVMCELSEIYPETDKVIKSLYKLNKRISIVTGKPRERVIEILKKYNLENYISDIVGYGEYEKSKPNPESLIICINKSNIDRNKTVYIGDSKYDVMAAEQAGITGILIDRNKSQKGAIKALDELLI